MPIDSNLSKSYLPAWSPDKVNSLIVVAHVFTSHVITVRSTSHGIALATVAQIVDNFRS